MTTIPPRAIPGPSGERSIPGPADLWISWSFSAAPPAVEGRLWLGDAQGTFQLYTLDRAHPFTPVALSDGRRSVTGFLRFEIEAAGLRLNGQLKTGPSVVYEGPIAEWLEERECPVALCGPRGAGVLIENPCEREIFSFLVPAERPHGGAAARRFIVLADPESLPLYVALDAVRSDLGALQAAAGEVAVPTLQGLGAPFDRFPALWQRLWDLTGTVERADLESLAEGFLGEPPETWLPANAGAWSLLWEGLLAFTYTGGPGSPLGPPLVLGLRIFAFLERLVLNDPDLLEEKGRRDVLAGIVVIPEGAVPLQPAPAGDAGFSALFGPGLLKVLRQRLLRYQPGEVAFTVNAMARERRTLTDRSLSRSAARDAAADVERRQERQEDVSEGASDLRDELEQLLAAGSVERDWDVTKTYNSNGLESEDKGTWSCKSSPALLQRTRNGLVQRLTHLAGSRTGQRVERHRQLRLAEERERITRCDLDNRSGEAPLVGLYRWLDQVFSFVLSDRGPRLVVELMIPQPAAGYVASVQTYGGLPPAPPPPLAQEGISSPADVQQDNYLELGAIYGLAGLEPPPTASLVVSTASAAPAWVSSGEIAIPPGYAASGATVSLAVGENQNVSILLGAYTNSSAASQILTVTQSELGEVGASIPYAFLSTSNTYAFGISVSCTPSNDAFAAWQTRTYNALTKAWIDRNKTFHDEVLERSRALGGSRRREVERQWLQSGGIGLLWARHLLPDADQPAYQRFFDRAFEWSEMAYRFYPWGTGAAPEPPQGWAGQGLLDPRSDALFLSFLEAGSARVLVPVVPEQSLAVLFYFAFGFLPPWTGSVTPVAQGSADLLSFLLTCTGDPGEQRWTEQVPTSLLVLQGGEAFPEYEA